MALTGIADAEQLAELARLLDEFSTEAGIEDDEEERSRLAARIISLFNDGITSAEEIKRHLDSRRASI